MQELIPPHKRTVELTFKIFNIFSLPMHLLTRSVFIWYNEFVMDNLSIYARSNIFYHRKKDLRHAKIK